MWGGVAAPGIVSEIVSAKWTTPRIVSKIVSPNRIGLEPHLKGFRLFQAIRFGDTIFDTIWCGRLWIDTIFDTNPGVVRFADTISDTIPGVVRFADTISDTIPGVVRFADTISDTIPVVLRLTDTISGTNLAGQVEAGERRGEGERREGRAGGDGEGGERLGPGSCQYSSARFHCGFLL